MDHKETYNATRKFMQVIQVYLEEMKKLQTGTAIDHLPEMFDEYEKRRMMLLESEMLLFDELVKHEAVIVIGEIRKMIAEFKNDEDLRSRMLAVWLQAQVAADQKRLKLKLADLKDIKEQVRFANIVSEKYFSEGDQEVLQELVPFLKGFVNFIKLFTDDLEARQIIGQTEKENSKG